MYYATKKPSGRQTEKDTIIKNVEQVERGSERGKAGYVASHEQRAEQMRNLVTDFQIQTDPMPLSKLWHTAESKLSLIIQIVLKANKVSFAYYEMLVRLCKRIVIDMPANAMATGNMDICRHIKIKY